MNKWAILGIVVAGAAVAIAMSGGEEIVAQGDMVGDAGVAKWRIRSHQEDFVSEYKLPGGSWLTVETTDGYAIVSDTVEDALDSVQLKLAMLGYEILAPAEKKGLG